MFTVVYTPVGGTSPADDITADGIRRIDVAPQISRDMPESIRLDAGVGGGGQLEGGVIIPAANVVSIDVTANIST